MKLLNIFKKKQRLVSKSIMKEAGKYSEWKKGTVKLADSVGYTLYIQPYISSYEVDSIMEQYGMFLEKFSKNIEESYEKDSTLYLKIMMGIFYSFLIRYKSDILSEEEKTIAKEVSYDDMFAFAINFIKLNKFSAILDMYDKESLEILFGRLNDILHSASNVERLTSFVKELDKTKVS